MATKNANLRIMILSEGIVIYDIAKEVVVGGPYPTDEAAEAALAEING
jgi:hypothetical protein